MRTDDSAARGVLTEAGATKRSILYSPRSYAFGAIVCAFLAGMKMQAAIVHFRAGKSVEFLEFITILLWLAISIRWVFLALPLSRKATSSTPDHPSSAY